MEKKNEYVKLWISYESYFEPYSAEQIGNLILAMMRYRKDGIEPDFSGPERFVWPAIKRDIDESLKAQEASAQSHRESGKLGGRPKNQNGREQTKENQNNQNGFDETKKRYRTKDKDKDKGQGKGQGHSIPPKSPQGETPDDVLEGRKIPEPIKAQLRKWFQYKKERREAYKPTGLMSFLSAVEKKCAMYGEEDIVSLIEESMSNNWRGIIWEKLSGKERSSERTQQEEPEPLPADLAAAKQRHEEAMERFRAGEAGWEDLVL